MVAGAHAVPPRARAACDGRREQTSIDVHCRIGATLRFADVVPRSIPTNAKGPVAPATGPWEDLLLGPLIARLPFDEASGLATCLRLASDRPQATPPAHALGSIAMWRSACRSLGRHHPRSAGNQCVSDRSR